MRILAIDPGTKCGWALEDGEFLISGVWDLKPRRFEGGGMRYARLHKYLVDLCPLDRVFYEEVRAHAGTDAAQIYGGFTAVITAFCEARSIPYAGLPVGPIKKFATGKGNASKEMMVSSAKQRWSDQDIRDDNQADALWILQTAKANYLC